MYITFEFSVLKLQVQLGIRYFGPQQMLQNFPEFANFVTRLFVKLAWRHGQRWVPSPLIGHGCGIFVRPAARMGYIFSGGFEKTAFKVFHRYRQFDPFNSIDNTLKLIY